MEISPTRANFFTKRFVKYLHEKNCNVSLVKEMISLGADVNYRDRSLNTVLHIVLQHCYDKFNLVHELLVSGAPVNACNAVEQSALHYAVLYCDDVEVLKELIAHGAIVRMSKYTNSPLHLAVKNNRKSFVEVLHQGADINGKNKKGETPLKMAVINDNLEIVKLLLSLGASVSIGLSKSSPLHLAVKKSVANQSIMIELMKYGADVHCNDSKLKPPLQYAVEKYYSDCSDNLLSAKTLIKCNVLQAIGHFRKFRSKTFSEKWLFKKYSEYSLLFAFHKECLLEAKRMKSEFINNTFSLLTFIQEGFEFKEIFEIHTAYKEFIFNRVLHLSRNYPIYADVLAYRLGKSNLCLKSMELNVYASKEFSGEKQKIFLTPDSIFYIGKFLSNEDVLNLITAFSHSQYFATSDFGLQNLTLGKSIKRKLTLDF